MKKKSMRQWFVHQPVHNVSISVSVMFRIKAHHEANGSSLSEWCNAETRYHRMPKGLVCKRLWRCCTSCEGNNHSLQSAPSHRRLQIN